MSRTTERIPATAVAIALGVLLAVAFAATAQPVALTGATVHPVSGPPIEGGIVVVEGATIASVGTDPGAIPAGAQRIDLTGLHLYPGFLHADSQLGLIEIDSVRGTVDTREIEENNAHLRAEVAVNADSLLLPVAVSGGVLTAQVVPGGGLFSGTSAVVQLEGWNWEQMTLRAPVGQHLRFPQPRRGRRASESEEDDEKKTKALEKVDKILDAARAYGRARDAAARGEAPAVAFDPRLEALQPLLDGEMTLFIHARTKAQIVEALDWRREQELGPTVLVAGSDAAYVADRIAEQGVPVILESVLRTPSREWEPYDIAYTAAARLHSAGVKVAIGGDNDASSARNLPFHAAMAAAYGLPKEEALASVTLRPAEILGVADRLGSIEPGKRATFFAATGDPLEIRERIVRVWIAGEEIDLGADSQRRLFEKYRSRPLPTP